MSEINQLTTEESMVSKKQMASSMGKKSKTMTKEASTEKATGSLAPKSLEKMSVPKKEEASSSKKSR